MLTPRQNKGLAPKEFPALLKKLPKLPQELGDCLGEFLITRPVTPLAPARKISRGAGPPMRKALLADSVEQVEAALASDADAAWEPFWDHHMEPPLCLAARRLCDPAIVKLLLEHGASIDAVDAGGLSAPELLLPATLGASLDRWHWVWLPEAPHLPAPQPPTVWPEVVDPLKCFCDPLLPLQPAGQSMRLREEASRRDAIEKIFEEQREIKAQQAEQHQSSAIQPSEGEVPCASPRA